MILHHHTAFRSGGGEVPGSAKSTLIGARIIALVEEVDSQLHGLFPHSQPEQSAAVLKFVASGRGSLFDPEVVDAFSVVLSFGAMATHAVWAIATTLLAGLAALVVIPVEPHGFLYLSPVVFLVSSISFGVGEGVVAAG